MIVPYNMVPDLLKQLHHGHCGAEICLNRAKDVVSGLTLERTCKNTSRSALCVNKHKKVNQRKK
jgi:hypothetical protein